MLHGLGGLSCALGLVSAAACAANLAAAPNTPRLLAEWEPAVGALVTFPFEIPDALVRDLGQEARLYVLVGADDQGAAVERLGEIGVRPEQREIVIASARTPWTRDWGPHQVQLPDGRVALVDHVFRGYPWVPAEETIEDVVYRRWSHEGDDAATRELAAHLGEPLVELPAIATGGNLLTDGRGRAFCTRAQVIENAREMSEETYRELLRERLGIEDLVVLENTEPFGIQHIDCWLKVLDEGTLLVKRPPEDHPEHAPIARNLERLEALRTPAGKPYRIVRIDCPRYHEDDIAAYTNSLMLNGVVHVPLFGIPADEDALATYREALPNWEVRGYVHDGWRHFDALHCRTRALFRDS
jgi:agmatine/peptidylarginine deiminase